MNTIKIIDGIPHIVQAVTANPKMTIRPLQFYFRTEELINALTKRMHECMDALINATKKNAIASSNEDVITFAVPETGEIKHFCVHNFTAMEQTLQWLQMRDQRVTPNELVVLTVPQLNQLKKAVSAQGWNDYSSAIEEVEVHQILEHARD